MTHYPSEFKASTMAKMLPPQSRSVRELAQETGIPKDTLYSWRTLAVKADPAAAPAPSGTGRAQQRAEVRRGAADQRAGCRRLERLLPRAGPLPAAGRGLADGLPAG
jgi:transposase-like protein